MRLSQFLETRSGSRAFSTSSYERQVSNHPSQQGWTTPSLLRARTSTWAARRVVLGVVTGAAPVRARILAVKAEGSGAFHDALPGS